MTWGSAERRTRAGKCGCASAASGAWAPSDKFCVIRQPPPVVRAVAATTKPNLNPIRYDIVIRSSGFERPKFFFAWIQGSPAAKRDECTTAAASPAVAFKWTRFTLELRTYGGARPLARVFTY